MRAIREPSFAASLLLAGGALFFGGGPADGSLLWLGAGALAIVLWTLAVRGAPAGALALVPLALLVAWLAVTIAWSTLPDRSWEVADRGLVYVLAAAAGLCVARYRRELALGLAALLGAVAVWALLTRVAPSLGDVSTPFGDRLRAPVGLWNQLALLGCFALPLALWRKRLEGTLLAYAWAVALLLTYSRGGLLTAVAVLAVWFWRDDERIDSAVTLAAAAVPAGLVVACSLLFAKHGAGFAVLVLLGAVAAGALERLPRPRATPALRRAALAVLAVLAVAALVFVVVKGTGSGAVGNGGRRVTSTSSNFRFTWWKQAWQGFEGHVLGGTGAGTFRLTNLLHRETYLDTTTEPHDLPLQFLSETGLVGLALFLLAAAALVRPSLHRRGHELALGLFLPAWLLHGLVDVDWDFAAVSVPAFLAAGALAGGAPRRVSPFAVLAAAGAALLAAGALLLPWLGNRWSDEATSSLSTHTAERARSVDPLLVEPLWTLALAAELRGRDRLALAYYDEAIRKQPHNPETWLLAGRFALDNGCPRLAYTRLEKFTELDNKARQDRGGDAYRRARDLVNTGKPTC